MNRGKHQAIYKFLPNMWVSISEPGRKTVTGKVLSWNCNQMEGVYDDFINLEIRKQLAAFERRGGIIASFSSSAAAAFKLVEASCNENVPDIVAEISPLFFYCSKCHRAFETKTADAAKAESFWQCECGGTIKQLQMIYSCECGWASAIQIPFVKGTGRLEYTPNENQYKMKQKSGKNIKFIEFNKKCPECGQILFVSNAEEGKNFNPFIFNIVNLLNKKKWSFLESCFSAKKLVVAHWLGIIDDESYNKYIEDPSLLKKETDVEYEDKEARALAEKMIRMGFNQSVEELIIKIKGDKGNDSVSNIIEKVNDIFVADRGSRGSMKDLIEEVSFLIEQYNTIKFAKNIITVDDAVQHLIDLELIDDNSEIRELHKALGIQDAQVSCDIEIISGAFGYTRKTKDPHNTKNNNLLKLLSFGKWKDGASNRVYADKLETEGLLLEIDQSKILRWLSKNNVIDDTMLPDMDDDCSIKKWFLENVKDEEISSFYKIDEMDQITKSVFSLLHSISHAFLKQMGKLSGLSSNSLSEIINTATTSIFIYAQTSQGIPLGAISGMMESNYYQLLKEVFNESRSCIYDPICTERDDTNCSGCLVLPDISCCHFNGELGRKYLYTIQNSKEKFTGFWEM